MKILLSCLQDLRLHPIPAYRFWANYFKNGIIEAGHEWIEVPEVDWAEGCTALSPSELRAWRERTWGKMLEWLRQELVIGRKIDLFLSYFYPQQISVSAIREIQKLGIPCVNFFCDNVREFTQIPDAFKVFDLHWVPEWEALDMYARARVKTCFAPMPCWIPVEARSLATSENGQVTFVGSCDELRRILLSKALAMGAAIMIGGVGWGNIDNHTAGVKSISELLKNQFNFARQRGLSQWLRKIARRFRPVPSSTIPKSNILPRIDVNEYFRLTKESTITIGINRVPTFRRALHNSLKYSRLRDIEAPMMGACYLTEWTGGLPHLYDIGTEIETYRTAEEMASKIRALQADPRKRASLRRRGQQRALSELSVARSLEKIAAGLGLSRLR